VRISSIRITE